MDNFFGEEFYSASKNAKIESRRLLAGLIVRSVDECDLASTDSTILLYFWQSFRSSRCERGVSGSALDRFD